MKHWIHAVLLLMITAIFISNLPASITYAADVSTNAVPRLPKEVLKEELDNPDFIIIDVRSKSQWEAGEWKIKNSVWEDPTQFESWANFKYSRDKTFVLSCA
jgi:hypothetical protein